MTSNSTADTAGWNIGKVDATNDQYRHQDKTQKLQLKDTKVFHFSRYKHIIMT